MRDTCSKFVEALFESDSFKESCSTIAVIYDCDIKSRGGINLISAIYIDLDDYYSVSVNQSKNNNNVCIKQVLYSLPRHCVIYSIDNVRANHNSWSETLDDRINLSACY